MRARHRSFGILMLIGCLFGISAASAQTDSNAAKPKQRPVNARPPSPMLAGTPAARPAGVKAAGEATKPPSQLTPLPR